MTAPRPVTGPQLRKIHALYRDIGITDRDARLKHASEYLYRDVASTNELSLDEAKLLIDHLDRAVA